MSKIKAKCQLHENVRSIADNTRAHSVVCDLPTDSGGTDTGSTALELSLMSLAGCGVTIFADVCKNSKIDPGKIQVHVEADKSPDSPIIHGVTMKVTINSKARKELINAAWRRTEANCPVLYIFKENIPVKVEVEVKSE